MDNNSKQPAHDEGRRNTFENEFEELLDWPYSVNAIDGSLDVKLIEGRGKQILYQGLRQRDVIVFAGSGLSVPYGHITWQDWCAIQVDAVVDAAKAFSAWAEAQRDFNLKLRDKADKEANSKPEIATLSKYLDIKSNELAYPKAQIDRILTTLVGLGRKEPGASGDVAPIRFQVVEQLHKLWRRACEDLKIAQKGSNSGPARKYFLQKDFRERLTTANRLIFKSETEFQDDVGRVGKKLEDAVANLEKQLSSPYLGYDYATLAKILLVDEAAPSSLMIERMLRTGPAVGRSKPEAISLDRITELSVRKEAASKDNLKRNQISIRDGTGRYDALYPFFVKHDKDGKNGQNTVLEHCITQNLWPDAATFLANDIKDNGQAFILPHRRFAIEMLVALSPDPEVLLAQAKQQFPNAQESAALFKGRKSIIRECLDPIQSLLGGFSIRRVVTTNYDFELERYYQDFGYRTFSGNINNDLASDKSGPYRIDGLGGRVADSSFDRSRSTDLMSFAVDQDNLDAQIFHLHGNAEQSSQIVMTERDYMDLYLRNDANRPIIDDGIRLTFSSSPILFTGLGMAEADILRPLRQFLSDRDLAAERKAVAFLPALEDFDLRVKDAAALYIRYGIHTVFYGDGYVNVGDKQYPIDWLHSVLKLIDALIKVNEIPIIVKHQTPDQRVINSDIKGYLRKELGHYQVLNNKGKLEKVFRLDIMFGSDPSALSPRTINYKSMPVCVFQTLRRLQKRAIIYKNHPKTVDKFLSFERDLLAFLTSKTIFPMRIKGDKLKRELNARLIGLRGLKGAFLTGAYSAGLTYLQQEYEKWTKNWQEGIKPRPTLFRKMEPKPTNTLDSPIIPPAFVRHCIFDDICNPDELKDPTPRGHANLNNLKHKTGFRMFDTFIEAVLARTKIDTENSTRNKPQFSLGRRLHLVLGKRGTGKGSFQNTFQSPLGFSNYVTASWPDPKIPTVYKFGSRHFETRLPPEYISSCYVNLSFSSEVTSVFDMLAAHLAGVAHFCETLIDNQPNDIADLKKRILEQGNHSNAARTSDTAQGVKNLSRLQKLIYWFERIKSLQDEWIEKTEVANLVEKLPPLRFLIHISPIDVLHHAGGLPKNRDVEQFLRILTGEVTRDCPVDVILVSSVQNLGPVFSAKGGFVEAYKRAQQLLINEGMYSTPERTDEDLGVSNKLKFFTIVRTNIELSNLRGVMRRESRSGIQFQEPLEPLRGQSMGARPIALGSTDPSDACFVYFARPMRPANLLIIDFMPLALILGFRASHSDNMVRSGIDAGKEIETTKKQYLNHALQEMIGGDYIEKYFEDNLKNCLSLSLEIYTAIYKALPNSPAYVSNSGAVNGQSVLLTSLRTMAERLIAESNSGTMSKKWDDMADVLRDSRFSFTILLAAAQRIALSASDIDTGGKLADAFITNIVNKVRAASDSDRESTGIQAVLDLYSTYHELGNASSDNELHELLLRHLAVASAPLSADVIVRMPFIRKHFDQSYASDYRRRSLHVEQALVELVRRGLVFRLQPQAAFEDTVGAKDASEPHKAYRYALHRLMQRHTLEKLGEFRRDMAEANTLAPSMFVSMPADLPKLTPDSYHFLRVLVSNLSQYPDGPTSEHSIQGWHYGDADPVTQVQALRSALTMVRTSFSTAVVSRFEDYKQSEADAGNRLQGYFEIYRTQVRWIIRKAANLSKLKNGNGKASKPIPSPLYADETAWLYNECGVTSLVQGNLIDAKEQFQQALYLNVKNEGSIEGGMQFNRMSLNLAVTLIESGEMQEARRRLNSICESDVNNSGFEGRLWHLAHGYLGLIKHISGDFEGARRNYKRAIEMLRAYDDKRAISVFLRHSGDMERTRDNLEVATLAFDQAIDFAAEGGHEDMRQKALLAKLRLEATIANKGAGIASRAVDFMTRLNSAAEYAATMEMPSLECEVLHMRAEFLIAQGETILAGTYLAKCMAIAKRNGMKLRLTAAVTLYARLLAMRGMNEPARRLIATSTEMAKRTNNQLAHRKIDAVEALLRNV